MSYEFNRFYLAERWIFLVRQSLIHKPRVGLIVFIFHLMENTHIYTKENATIHTLTLRKMLKYEFAPTMELHHGHQN